MHSVVLVRFCDHRAGLTARIDCQSGTRRQKERKVMQQSRRCCLSRSYFTLLCKVQVGATHTVLLRRDFLQALYISRSPLFFSLSFFHFSFTFNFTLPPSMTMNNTTSKESSKLFTTGILPTFTFVVDGPEGMLNKNESQQQRHTKHRSSQHTVGSNEQRQKQPHGKEDTADITLSTTTTRVVPPGPLHIVPSWQPLDANDKPPYSYATLIAHAILSSEDRRLTLGDIYQWITQHYPFYSMSENGWQVCKRTRARLCKRTHLLITLFYL